MKLVPTQYMTHSPAKTLEASCKPDTLLGSGIIGLNETPVKKL